MSWFNSKQSKRDLTSLNPVSSPAPSGDQRAPTASSGVPPFDRAALLRDPVPEELERRTKLLLQSGQRPRSVFLLASVQPNGHQVFTFIQQNPARHSLPLFSSPFAAQDYASATNSTASVLSISLDSIANVNQSWRDSGIDSFLMNRCPRCPVATLLTPNDGLITKEQVAFAWAASYVLRQRRADHVIQQLNAATGDTQLSRKIELLEFFRDHVDCGVPFVHWQLAILAGVKGDEQLRLAAVEQLEKFGAEFQGKVTRMDDPSDPKPWLDAASAAQAGLLGWFGLVNTTKDSPTK